MYKLLTWLASFGLAGLFRLLVGLLLLRLIIFFEKLPSDLKTQGLESGWMSVLKAGQRFLAPYQSSDIHTATNIQEFGFQEFGAIGEG